MSVEAISDIPGEELRKRSLSDPLRTGHSAPAVMQTMLDASDSEAEWLVLLVAGLPGGHDLARWFDAQLGSSQCRALTGCDVASADGVSASIERDGTTECARVAHVVAAHVAGMVVESS